MLKSLKARLAVLLACVACICAVAAPAASASDIGYAREYSWSQQAAASQCAAWYTCFGYQFVSHVAIAPWRGFHWYVFQGTPSLHVCDFVYWITYDGTQTHTTFNGCS